MEKYYSQFENCHQHHAPDCQNTCPFGVDILDFQEKMAKNRYNMAYKILRAKTVFPDIVAALCPQYCASGCLRGAIDQPVQINLLEKTCVAKARQKAPTDYNIPAKNKKVAIIGAGSSGLACALKLCLKKYDVTVYEKTDRLGGALHGLLPDIIFLEDIRKQFQHETYELHLNTEIKALSELADQNFDAVYIATGKGGVDFGTLDRPDAPCFVDGTMAVFAGGNLTGKDVVRAIADGAAIAWSIEVYLQTGKLEYPADPPTTRLPMSPHRFQKAEVVIPAQQGLFTDEEVAAEAARCMRCQCDACRSYCALSEFSGKWPLQMRDEIMTTTMASASMIHKTPAIRLINMCTRCEQCEAGCPGGIQLGQMIRQARYKLHRIGKMPGAYHQFWLRDMEFASSDLAALTMPPPGREECGYAFFPGCHLGASDPEYVLAPYRWLLAQQPDTGLFLRCCGVPADWAGNEDMHHHELVAIRADWEKLGKPTLIFACPSCMRHFKHHLPEIKATSLYEMLDELGYAPGSPADTSPQTGVPEKTILEFGLFGVETGAPEKTMSELGLSGAATIFDPCSSHREPSMQEAVRHLAEKAGIPLSEIPEHQKGGCCGFGGHIAVANPDYAGFLAKKSGALSPLPYLVYCMNCRDAFHEENKPAKHILDILFPACDAVKTRPSLTQRRQNRILLKETLLKTIWGKDMVAKPTQCAYKLLIGAEVQEKMDRLRLLADDICEVLSYNLTSGRRTFDKTNNLYTCYREIGAITCWLQYRPHGDAFEIINVYTHRMKIELEAVWNGRKTDVDL